MSSCEGPLSGLNLVSSVCWRGEQHIRRDRVVDAFRSDRVDIDERGARDFVSIVGNWICYD